ncbi:glycine cleavage system T protein [Anopheles sinensis]|uniref:Glycine cleavage system T protein n=1 Tax=Anopheles sinensis TaxID=74873 RepID=A0A084WD78_ANOSI|nr:glycine cleavage system T protein [Anopheles sinensis]
MKSFQEKPQPRIHPSGKKFWQKPNVKENCETTDETKEDGAQRRLLRLVGGAKQAKRGGGAKRKSKETTKQSSSLSRESRFPLATTSFFTTTTKSKKISKTPTVEIGARQAPNRTVDTSHKWKGQLR